MKLCAIYSVWHDWDILEYSLKNLWLLVDGVIIIGSENSNFGERSEIPIMWKNDIRVYQRFSENVQLFIREPQFHVPRQSETDKRNYGLQVAREQGYTHFLTIDSDEFYDPKEFKKAKERFNSEPNLKGLVCDCQTFFKSPTLTIGLDTTLVPFIHELTPTITHEFNRKYPFAWDSKGIRIDPTRSLNINSGVEKIDLKMFHYSWVRKDYHLKIRNSTARTNLERSTILEDLANAKPGYHCKFYNKVLTECENPFGIPEF
jgi:hypothetical protein